MTAAGYDLWWPLPVLVALVVLGGALLVAPLLRRLGSPPRTLAPFTARPLLNRSETRLAAVLDDYARARGLRLLVQVSYGEFLQTKDRASFLRVNAKRADFALADAEFRVHAIIELHGGGHYGRSVSASLRARESDRVKEAVRSAGIAFLVVPERHGRADVWAALDGALDGSPGEPAQRAT